MFFAATKLFQSQVSVLVLKKCLKMISLSNWYCSYIHIVLCHMYQCNDIEYNCLQWMLSFVCYATR